MFRSKGYISVDGEIYQGQLIYKMNQLFPGQKYMTGWKQSNSTQGKPYQTYYLNPTIETVSTAAIVRRGVDGGKAQAARNFLDFVAQKQQQEIFVKYGFRPIINSLDLKSVAESPWSKNIPGAEVSPGGRSRASPDAQILEEVKRLWVRAN